jgi:hypothetical protein
VRLRVVNHDIDVQRVDRTATEPLDHTQRVAVRMAAFVERGLFREADSLGHQCVAIPAAD